MIKKLTSAASTSELPVSESPKNTAPLTDNSRLKLALKEKLKRGINVNGEFHLPCVPSITQGDVLDPLLRIKTYRYKLAIATEVLSHFRHIEQVRLFLGKMSDSVLSGGFILFSAFLAVDGYEPDDMAKQMSEQSWSFLITRQELSEAIEGLPLEIVSDESVIEYEQQHLPKEAWPPTSWFQSWASGRDLLPLEPLPSSGSLSICVVGKNLVLLSYECKRPTNFIGKTGMRTLSSSLESRRGIFTDQTFTGVILFMGRRE